MLFMKQNYATKAAIVAMLFAGLTFTACSDDDDPTKKGEDPNVDKVDGTLTPTESKKYIEETATEFLNYFDPEDQKGLINLVDHFNANYGHLNAPEFWDEDDEEPSPAFLPKQLTGLGKALRAGSYLAASKYVTTYNINFAKYAGIYQPGTRSWDKVGESSDIIFRFKDSAGATAELKLTGSGSEYNIDYTDESGYDDQYVDEYHVRIPSELHMTLVSGDIKLIDSTVKSSASLTGHTVSLNVEATVTNLGFFVTFNGSDNQITESSSVTVDGTRVITSTATANGSHLCDKAYYDDMLESNDDDAADIFADMLTSGDAKIDVLGRIQVIGSVNNYKKLYRILSYNYYDWETYTDKAEANAAAMADAELCNTYMPVYMTYTNTGAHQADIKFMPEFDGNPNSDAYWSYELNPVIAFPDETTYTFEEYFSSARFASVVDLLNSVIDKYENIWN